MPNTPSFLQILILAICVFWAGTSSTAETIAIDWDDLRDVENRPISIADAKWKVICFLGAECPLAVKPDSWTRDEFSREHQYAKQY